MLSFIDPNPETYLGPSQISKIVLFAKILYVVCYFDSSMMFERILVTPVKLYIAKLRVHFICYSFVPVKEFKNFTLKNYKYIKPF